MNINMECTYHQFLIDKILYLGDSITSRYYILFKELDNYYFDVLVRNDINRVESGMSLRREFQNFMNIPILNLPANKISFLELMIHLSDEMHKLNGETLGYNFFKLLNNAHLDVFDDVSYGNGSTAKIQRILFIINNRDYDRDGNGSFFPIHKSRFDLRDVELWYQMHYYIENNYKLL